MGPIVYGLKMHRLWADFASHPGFGRCAFIWRLLGELCLSTGQLVLLPAATAATAATAPCSLSVLLGSQVVQPLPVLPSGARGG